MNNTMINPKTSGIIIVLLILAVIVSACTNAGVSSNPTQANAQSNPASTPPAANTPVKLADSQYAPYSYIISGDSINPAAQQAMSGFSLTKSSNKDGTTTIALSSTNPEYQSQTYTLKPGEKLYFLETNMGDDPNNQENALGDDTAFIVDSDGYILQ